LNCVNINTIIIRSYKSNSQSMCGRHGACVRRCEPEVGLVWDLSLCSLGCCVVK